MAKREVPLALPLGAGRNPRNHRGVRAVTVITVHEDPERDTSVTLPAQLIQDIVVEKEWLGHGLIRKRYTVITIEEDR